MADQTKRIIYPNGTGGVRVLWPGKSVELTIEEIAQKDVPSGLPYRIVKASDIPTDRSQREAWTADFSKPDGFGGDDAGN